MRQTDTLWSSIEELKALYIHQFGTNNIPYSKEKVARQMERTETALEMRILNIEYLDTNGERGFSRYSQQTKLIYEKYKDTSESDLRYLAFSELTRS
jgi:hypothetical protein